MSIIHISVWSLIFIVSASAQVQMQYESSEQFPFGQLNPDAPTQTADFDPMIGLCDCKSVSRNQDGTWADTLEMVWKFKYIMNGYGVQDEVWRDQNLFAGSIRQFHQDSGMWVVSYYSFPSVPFKPGVWHGNKDQNQIVLYKDQKAPNGMEGDSRLTFFDMDKTKGFKWKGEWVSKNREIVYPFWQIFCTKRQT